MKNSLCIAPYITLLFNPMPTMPIPDSHYTPSTRPLRYMTHAYSAPDGSISAVTQGVNDGYGPLEEKAVQRLPEKMQQEVHEHLLTIDKVRTHYNSLLDSDLGKAFAREQGSYLTIDNLISANLGNEAVAATTPGTFEKNLIANKDNLEPFLSQLRHNYQLGEESAMWLVLLHELRHNYGQGKRTFKKGEFYTEIENELGLSKFLIRERNTAMAKGKADQAKEYEKMAEVTTDRFLNFYSMYLQHLGVKKSPEEIAQQLRERDIDVEMVNLDDLLQNPIFPSPNQN